MRPAVVVGACHLRQLATVLHHDDLVADGAHRMQVVADEQVRHAQFAPQLRDEIQHRCAHDGIQRRGDLVAQDQVRLGGQCARQAHPLLLSSR